MIELASDPSHPMHAVIYNRDRDEAAQEYYLSRARYIMRAIDVVVIGRDGTETQTRAFHVVYDDNKEDDAYVPMQVAFGNTNTKAQIIADARRMLESWNNLFGQYGYLGRMRRLVLRALEDE
jgi:hypothetical protein